MTGFSKNLITVSIFAIAMGFLESAVVVYIREINYPGGFDFPMVIPSGSIAVTELLREAATLVMLICVGLLAGRSISGRFAWFLYSFALWDYSGFVLETSSFSEIWSVPGEQLAEIISDYIPRKFNWFLFCLGECIILAGIVLFFRQNQGPDSRPAS